MNKEEILIGKTWEEAIELLRNCNYRVVSRDGKPFVVTHDFKPERYNIFIIDNKVSKVTFG